MLGRTTITVDDVDFAIRLAAFLLTDPAQAVALRANVLLFLRQPHERFFADLLGGAGRRFLFVGAEVIFLPRSAEPDLPRFALGQMVGRHIAGVDQQVFQDIPAMASSLASIGLSIPASVGCAKTSHVSTNGLFTS